MSGILDLVQDSPERTFPAGTDVMHQGETTGIMLILVEGEVEILRDNITVAVAKQPGAVFGEMAALLGTPHSATVRTRVPSKFAIIEKPRRFLEGSSRASLFVAELLAQRLTAVTKYLVDVKRQYEGHDHIGMVDDVLETLLHRPARPNPGLPR